jgi:hypothetical protein
VDVCGGFFNLGLFNSVEGTEDTPHFVLAAKPRGVEVFMSADTFDERANWVEALRKAIPRARKKMKVRKCMSNVGRSLPILES